MKDGTVLVAHVLHEGNNKTTMKLWICEYLASQYESLVNVIRILYIWKSSFCKCYVREHCKCPEKSMCNGVYLFGVEDSVLFTRSTLLNMFTGGTFFNMFTGSTPSKLFTGSTFLNMFTGSTFMNMFTGCTFINMFTVHTFSNRQCIRKMRFTFQMNSVQNDTDKIRTRPY